jgi:thioredoxin-related protein
MKHIIIFLAVLVLFIFISAKAKSFELLMFHSKYCHYCTTFDKEVGFDYNTLEVAKELPLTVIDFHNPPEWVFNALALGQINPVTATPTFVIWDPRINQEIDRLVGYKDREWFIEAMHFWLDNVHKNYPEFYDEDGNIKPDPQLDPEDEDIGQYEPEPTSI